VLKTNQSFIHNICAFRSKYYFFSCLNIYKYIYIKDARSSKNGKVFHGNKKSVLWFFKCSEMSRVARILDIFAQLTVVWERIFQEGYKVSSKGRKLST